MSGDYDPIERFYTFLTNAFNWESISVSVIRGYEYKNIDLRAGDFIVIERASERDDFLGIGALEFTRYVTVFLSVRTAESRQRLRQISEKLRNVIRLKENWVVDGKTMLNVRISRQEDRSDFERGIFTHLIEVEWFEIETRSA